ncbi:hypothetical protein ACFLX7_04055 [Chloroflexota bacterium]
MTTDWHYSIRARTVLDNGMRVVTIKITDMLYLSLITVPGVPE